MTRSSSRSHHRDLVRARELAESQFGIVAAWQLRASGIGERRAEVWVRAGRLMAVRPGVYSLGHLALSQQAVLMVAVLSAGPGALLSHQSAAGLFGFNESYRGAIHVIGRSSRFQPARRAPVAPPLRVHRTNFLHEEDRERTARFELAGYRVLRLTWAMIFYDEEATVRKVREYLRLAATTSTARAPVQAG